MKIYYKIIFGVLIFIGLTSCGQNSVDIDSRLIGVWMDKNLEYFQIDTLIRNGGGIQSKYKFQLNGFLGSPKQNGNHLTLKLVSGYYLKYDIVKLTTDSLWLTTTDEQTKKVHNTNFVITDTKGDYETNRKDFAPFNDTIKFYNSKLLLEREFDFHELIYQSTLPIDENDTVLRYVEINQNGDVFGKFSKDNLKENQYKHIHLDSLEIEILKEKILLANLLRQNDELIHPYIKIKIKYSDTEKTISWTDGGVPFYSIGFLDYYNKIMDRVYQSDTLIYRKIQ